jgi:lambda family phage portal protein
MKINPNATLYERILGFFSPTAAHRRFANRRAYEAAQTYLTSDWISASNGSANAEISKAQAVLQRKSRDLARNNPYALRSLDVIVNNTVGAGIVANIKGRNKTQVKKLTELWKQVAETTKCDADGISDFYALQALAMRSMVESGEALALRYITLEAPQIRILESDFIVSTQDTKPYTQGIKLDSDGRKQSFLLYKNHPGDANYSTGTSSDYLEIPAERVAHIYKLARPGQLRGVPWSHAVIETLKDFADYQYSTLIAKKIAACHVGVITSNGSDSVLDAIALKAKREAEMQMTPGQWRYLNNGEDVKFNNPPGSDGYAEFVRESMRAVAAGYGISYEAMTGDYSQVNFSSGRMGHIEFRRNIDMWRWNILIPHFCNPYFKWFLEWAKARGFDTEGASVEWVPPAHTMIDPTKEVAAEKEAVLAGFKSRSQVIREAGYDPDSVREEIKKERDADQVAGLKFDTDIQNVKPTSSGSQGQNSENSEEDASGSRDPSDS